MYSGLGRLIITSERKKTFQLVTHYQEVFLHLLPLSYLVILNGIHLKFSQLAIVAIFTAVLSLLFILTEILWL